MENFRQLVNRPVTMDLHVKSIRVPREGPVRDHAVFCGINSRGESIVCTGCFPGLRVGLPIRVNGTYQIYRDRISGTDKVQIKADGCAFLQFTSTSEIRQYLIGLGIPGCGPKTVDRIIEEYGIETVREITDAPDRFVERNIPGVSIRARESIRDTVTDSFHIHDAYSFLIRKGFGEKTAAELADIFGRGTEAAFTADPYSFTLECPDISFKQIDGILVNAGNYEALSPDRIASAVMHIIRTDSAAGHVFTDETDLKTRVFSLLELPQKESAAFRIAYMDAIGKLSVCRKAVIDGKRRFFPAGRESTEKVIASMLHVLHLNPVKNPYGSPGKLFLRRESLSMEQKKAVWNVFENPLSIITGGPGTGKSFITRIIYEAAENAGLLCMAAAPTGRAARRLDSAIFGGRETEDSIRPKTIHRLLKAESKGGFAMNSDNLLPYDLLIIDESSMIDIELAKSLLSAVSPRARVVFIGDENQLPPVGPGSFFNGMIESGCIPVTRLTQIFRQNTESGIVINARRVNEGEFPFCASKFGLRGDDFFYFECRPGQETSRLLSFAVDELSLRFSLDPLKDIQILAPTNVGISGTEKLNDMLREKLNPPVNGSVDYAVGGKTFRTGDKVMQISNDYSLMVYNGDIGSISGIENDLISVFFPDTGRTVVYSRNQARHLVLAYAISIHKAQGSETEAAVIVMDSMNSRNAERKQLYTAVTRARKAVVLIGERSAFQNALANRNGISRNTELAALIRERFVI